MDINDKKLEERALGQVDRWSGQRGKGRRLASTVAPNVERRDILPVDTNAAASSDEDTIVESSRRIPVLASCDVLVVGGGPAGTSSLHFCHCL
jgi:hypothetical protein